MTNWARLGDGAEAAYAQLKEEMVAHLVRLVQLDPDLARKSIQQHLSGELVPDPAKGFCLFPDIGRAVKARLDELGIVPAPREPEPWFLQQPDKHGWRLSPGRP